MRHKSWIFSFVPIGTTSFAVVRFANLEHATSFDRQVNIIAACGTNERGWGFASNDVATSCKWCDASHQWCCASRKRRSSRSFDPKAVFVSFWASEASRTFSSKIPNGTSYRLILTLLGFRLRSGWHGRKSARRSRSGIYKAARRVP